MTIPLVEVAARAMCRAEIVRLPALYGVENVNNIVEKYWRSRMRDAQAAIDALTAAALSEEDAGVVDELGEWGDLTEGVTAAGHEILHKAAARIQALSIALAGCREGAK